MHGPAHADRAFELAKPAPDGAPVLGSDELGMHVRGEKRPLHELNIADN